MDPIVPEDMKEHRLLETWGARGANQSSTVLPLDMTFNDSHVLSIVVYSVLMLISAVGNCTVLALLCRRDTPRTRINTMLVHLAIADLLVTFLMMPLEIAWSWTVSWWAGDLACRVMAFFRIFGLYLSSFVLICISVDRYYAVLKPLQLSGGERRGRALLLAAWISSAICSAPQMAIFHVERHPNVTWYEQCISYHAFGSETQELAYSLLNMALMYAAPLAAIIYCYASILREIIRRSRDSLDDKMRRSSLGFLGRARSRTLKMTITIVLVFFVCWTPYYVMALWFWVDAESAKQVDQRVQRGLFLFACTNSCMNPLVYGAFNVRARAQGSGRRVVTLRSANKRDLYSCGESLELPPHSSSRRK